MAFSIAEDLICFKGRGDGGGGVGWYHGVDGGGRHLSSHGNSMECCISSVLSSAPTKLPQNIFNGS